MKSKFKLLAHCHLLAALCLSAHAQGTAFNYQGRLNDGASLANGSYDMRFALFDANSAGAQQGSTITNNATIVSNGLFTVTLDFDNQFSGANRWLEIGVRTNGAAVFFILNPRQPLTPTPYAITAGNVTGPIVNAQLPASVVTNNATGLNLAGSFTGNGANLTNVNAVTLSGLTSAGLWQMNGNAGANPTNGAYLGTSDNLPLEFKVNSQRALRLEPNDIGAPNVIGGASVNFVAPGVSGATIGGGGATSYFGSSCTNSVLADFGTVGGGGGNQIQPDTLYSTISGGSGNQIQSFAVSSTIGGGQENQIQTYSDHSTIGGGEQNQIQINAPNSTIGGGGKNQIQTNASASTICGGYQNQIQSFASSSTIGGGQGNQIQTSAGSSMIGGGNLNLIQPNSLYSTIPGGLQNTAADYAFAAGYNARATNTGAFVWSDSTGTATGSTNANSVTFRASGGYRFFTGTGTGGAKLLAGATAWSVLSDRNTKKNFTPVNCQSILDKLAAVPLQQWNYKWEKDSDVPNLGPMAQDFKAAFFPGRDDTSISTLEFDGVELAAIKGLNQKLEIRAKENDARIQNLEAKLAELEAIVKQLANRATETAALSN